MGAFTLNMKLLPIKVHYFLFNGGTATVQPTMPVYSKVLGFSSFVVGTIYTILPILGLFIKPAFGALADKFKWHRGVLVAWEIIVVVVYFAIWFIPPAHPHDNSLNSTQIWSINSVSACSMSDATPYFLVEGTNCKWNCDITPQRCAEWKMDDFCAPYQFSNSSAANMAWSEPEERCVSINNAPRTLDFQREVGCQRLCKSAKITPSDDPSVTYSQWQFWLFLFLLVGAWGGTSVVTTLTDTLCIEICEDPSLYGKQRLWASIAWGLFSVVNGVLIDAVSSDDEEDKNYAPAFYLMLPPLLIDIVISYRLKFNIPEQSQSIVSDVWHVILKPKNAIFMIWCTMVGVSFGLVWNFLYWYLEDLAAAQGPDVVSRIKTIEGLVAGFETVLGETPAFFFGGWIVNKIGHGHSITLVFAAIGLRYTLYSLLVNPWWSLPIEILQNNYGLFYSTMTSYAKKVAPPGTEATVQSVMCAVCEGIGVAIGSFLGGLFYDDYGGSVTFLIFGIFFITLALINEGIELIYKILERREGLPVVVISQGIRSGNTNEVS